MIRNVVLAAIWLLAAPALADDGFALVETEEGMVRVDRQSGAVSYCRQINGAMACSVAADERVAWEKENERLLARIEELEGRIAKLEGAKPVDPPDDETVLTPQEERKLDKAMRVAETFMRRFVALMKDIGQDLQTQ